MLVLKTQRFVFFLHYLMLTLFYNLGMDRDVAVYICVADI
jgi:hypothetical protein